MTKEELVKEAEEYALANRSMCVEGDNAGLLKEVFLDIAEPREKQIQIDAEQIRALQKQNGELTDKVKELEEELSIKKELCSALGEDKVNLKEDNFRLRKENAELEDKLANADYQLEGRDNEIRELEKEIENYKLSEIEAKEIIAEQEEQIEKMKRCEICKHYRWNHCSYEINISKDCIQNKLKHFELKEIKENDRGRIF